jgi:hypothetical protein
MANTPPPDSRPPGTLVPVPVTANFAAERAAEALVCAQSRYFEPEQAAALVVVADGWTRLHVALAATPEPLAVDMTGPIVHVPDDFDPEKVAAELACRMGLSRPVEEISLHRERAHLVAYLATQYPATIAYNDPKEPDWPVCYIETPEGQMAWHIAGGDLDLFDHVPRNGLLATGGPVWDGHSTIEKYERLNALTRDIADRPTEG